MSATKTLFNRNGLPDPAKGNPLGKFSNPDLQSLNDSLVLRESISVSEALKIGGTIEEIDILNLEKHIAATTYQGFSNVYGNLIDSSSNHLRAIVSTLARRKGNTSEVNSDPIIVGALRTEKPNLSYLLKARSPCCVLW